MHGLSGEGTLMRIHIGERDKWHGKPLYQAIVELLRERHFAGATVLRAITGFGASARLRTDRVELLSLDLPIIVECVETEEKIQEILPVLDAMVGGADHPRAGPRHHVSARSPPGGAHGQLAHRERRIELSARPQGPPTRPVSSSNEASRRRISAATACWPAAWVSRARSSESAATRAIAPSTCLDRNSNCRRLSTTR